MDELQHQESQMKLFKLFRELLRDRTGATAIEYGLILALISTAIIVAVQGMGGELQTTFNTTSSAMSP
jgi:pilus assembly protein Flp/PilA